MGQILYFYAKRKGRKDWTYIDLQESKSNITTIETMAKLVSKIAAAFQHCDEKNEKCEFKITIEKEFIEKSNV